MNILDIINQIYNFINTGELIKAEKACLSMLEEYPDNPEIMGILGLVYFQLGNDNLAQYFLSKSLIIKPDNAFLLHNLGMTFLKKGDIDNAIISFQKALQLNQNLAYSCHALGLSYDIKGEYSEALKWYEKAIKIDSNIADAHNNIGIILQKMGKYPEAISSFKKALEINPKYAEVYSNMGLAYREYGLIDNSIEYYRKSLEINPELIDVHVNLALSLLLNGDYLTGWEEYEWRKKQLPKIFSKPFWESYDDDVSGKKILIYTEQGFGDAIQFIRYIPFVYELGAKIILICPKELKSLFQNIQGIYNILTFGEKIPDFDLHCPILSLPYIFKTTIENIPSNIPYLFPDKTIINKWAEKIHSDNNNKLKIGIAWSGRNHVHNINLFAPLSDINEVTFFSLQKGEAASQALNPPNGMKIIDYSDQITDFLDTAGIIMNLDLVISIDTSVAHLAGALGKNVWTLLTYVPDWRWLLNRKDSPWYPTMRLFRQKSIGNWNSVFSKVLNELNIIIRKNSFE
ncbi:MAG: tetratricopeptide repeat protein [Nitrospirae bacterium]|jgi:tetratricopeptide (TPR) repeat protein|nr:tetratricopeptide repeat protein [Nitrospirota bacterium]